MKHPVHMIALEERNAVIAHIAAKARLVKKRSNDFEIDTARVLTELIGDLRNEFHILDEKKEVGVVANLVNEEANDATHSKSTEDPASGD